MHRQAFRSSFVTRWYAFRAGSGGATPVCDAHARSRTGPDRGRFNEAPVGRYSAAHNVFHFDAGIRDAPYCSETKNSLHGYEAEQDVRKGFANASARNDVANMLSKDIDGHPPDHPVMNCDRMGIAHGLEVRSPSMDHAPAKFCATFPVESKVNGRSLRVLLRRLAERYLPPVVLKRPKQGFSSALLYILRAEYEPLSRSLLTEPQLVRAGYLRNASVKKLIREYFAGVVDHGTRLWLPANSEIRYRLAIVGNFRNDLKMGLRQEANLVA